MRGAKPTPQLPMTTVVTVPAGGSKRIPSCLPIIVCMDVDPSRCDQFPSCINLLMSTLIDLSDGCYLSILDCHLPRRSAPDPSIMVPLRLQCRIPLSSYKKIHANKYYVQKKFAKDNSTATSATKDNQSQVGSR